MPDRNAPPFLRLRVSLQGAVQGVGFRPFIHRLATDLNLRGWVQNSGEGVQIEVEGVRESLENFLRRLPLEKPPLSFIQSLESSWLDPAGVAAFEIRASSEAGPRTAIVMPDLATCPDCRAEIFDSSNRRFRYPFTNCTNCGPRFSIIESLPYDRANTSMKRFSMCPECAAEYHDPTNRRFHAQPNACPQCGPKLVLWNPVGTPMAVEHAALHQAAAALREGHIIALKGIGGFQLLVDARNKSAVDLLRQRKHREEKPFAVMFPSMEAVRAECEVNGAEAALLGGSASPIVLLRRTGNSLASSVAPNNPQLGAMLPYSPLHHLLLAELGFPMVATSGNLSDEPICIDEQEALARLAGIADFFLVHDRPIVRHVDDSVARILLGREQVLRRARGYAPLPIQLAPESNRVNEPVLAVGAHLKNAVALAIGSRVFISQHIGDLETSAAYDAFTRVAADLPRLYEVRPRLIAHDLHPDYLSTQFARRLAAGCENSRTVAVQHHVAHVLGCMAENELHPPVLGVSWDGTGYGSDNSVWGGEFFSINGESARRFAHFRQFRLPGGDRAVKEPRRSALGLLQAISTDATLNRADWHFEESELRTLISMLQRGVNSPLSSSVGRLFDAVASLLNVRQVSNFEGQAAMELEFALQGVETSDFFPFETRVEPGDAGQMIIIDWQPMTQGLLEAKNRGESLGRLSAKFHNTLAEIIVEVAKLAAHPQVALSGGCFQNRHLTERAVGRLESAGFRAYWHQRVPPNDGGIALGQIVATRWGLH